VILFYSSHHVEHNDENKILNRYHMSKVNYFKVLYSLRPKIKGHMTFKIYLIIKDLLTFQYNSISIFFLHYYFLFFVRSLSLSSSVIPVPNTQMTFLCGTEVVLFCGDVMMIMLLKWIAFMLKKLTHLISFI
jgi:hypothetical protein